ncbi:hypothetical protein FQR65_LT03189 [Abscondita terminalis]|nr:hypothetical protein FQR65_LT03189 [Abscondita terminalis]
MKLITGVIISGIYLKTVRIYLDVDLFSLYKSSSVIIFRFISLCKMKVAIVFICVFVVVMGNRGGYGGGSNDGGGYGGGGYDRHNHQNVDHHHNSHGGGRHHGSDHHGGRGHSGGHDHDGGHSSPRDHHGGGSHRSSGGY